MCLICVKQFPLRWFLLCLCKSLLDRLCFLQAKIAAYQGLTCLFKNQKCVLEVFLVFQSHGIIPSRKSFFSILGHWDLVHGSLVCGNVLLWYSQIYSNNYWHQEWFCESLRRVRVPLRHDACCFWHFQLSRGERSFCWRKKMCFFSGWGEPFWVSAESEP